MEKEGNRRFFLRDSLFLLLGFVAIKKIDESIGASKVREYFNMDLEEVRRQIADLEKTRWYCQRYLNFKSSDFVKSPRRMHKERKADCKGQSLMAWYLNSDNGFEPTFLAMYSLGADDRAIDAGHIICYQEGVRGYHVASEFRDGVYPSLEAMTRSYGREGYKRVTFDPKKVPNWVDTDSDLSPAFRSIDDRFIRGR